MARVYAILKAILIPDSIDRLVQCDVLLFCHDVDRGISLNGKAYSPLIDSLKEELEKRCLKCQTIAHPYSVLTGENGHSAPVSINRIYIIFRLLSKFLPVKLQHTTLDRLNVYRNILRASGARLIITIGAPEELCFEARRAECFHVELLHGLGYKFLPWGWDVRQPQHLPQGILSLDKVSTYSFSSLTSLGIEIRTIPHPFLKRFIFGGQRDTPKEWALKPLSNSNYKKEILVSLSWGYSGDHGPHIQFANILINGLFYDEIAEIVSTTFDIFWRFRFHPLQLRNPKYQHLLTYMDNFVKDNPNSEWRMSSSLPLVIVLKNCSGHLSMASMSCYEAAAVGVPSLMLCPNIQQGGMHEDWFTDLTQEGYVKKVTVNKEEILSWVHSVEKLPSRLSNLEDNAAWEDALDWMLSCSGLDANFLGR